MIFIFKKIEYYSWRLLDKKRYLYFKVLNPIESIQKLFIGFCFSLFYHEYFYINNLYVKFLYIAKDFVLIKYLVYNKVIRVKWSII